MTRSEGDDPVVHIVASSVESRWRPIDGVLHIWVNEDLDAFSRRRYIQQAREEHGRDRRRRAGLPFLIGAGLLRPHRVAGEHKVGAAVVAGVAAASVAAAVTLPAILDSNEHPAKGRPAIAAPPIPGRSHSPSRIAEPPRSSPPSAPRPSHSSPTASPSSPPPTRSPGVHAPAAGSSHRSVPRPSKGISVVKVPVTVVPTPSLPPITDPPTAPPVLASPVCLVRLKVPPIIGVRIGCSRS